MRIISKATILFAALLLSLTPVGQVAAVSGSDWRAGRIIDDAVFTNSNGMSVSEIQAFLNARVPTCDTWGTQSSEFGGGTRAQYGAANGNPAPFTCLKDYYEVPKTSPGAGEPASNYGGAAIPQGAQSAAQLISNAAIKYNISPKVLLVKLATESPGPLTSDDWPFKRQYLYAMGAHCPDSGPGGSANCDSNWSGFSLQMDEAAALLRWYLDSMTQPWWQYKKPYQNNSILWRVVESGCGAGNVYIESKATAALYTYTPYQPNQAALNNMYGTGDGCSSYGNRNFWRVFSDWFGLPRTSMEYAWTSTWQAGYQDSNRTQQFTRGNVHAVVAPGSTTFMQVKARNDGYKVWTPSVVRLGTSNHNDRCSGFANNTWLSCQRVAMVEQQVLPGDTATFNFSITAPQNTGSYREHFNLVAEGVTWMHGHGIYFDIDVVEPAQPQTTKNTLTANEFLSVGANLLTTDYHTTLAVQRDGNTVLAVDGKALWSTGTPGYKLSKLIMQADGNVVLYGADGIPAWSSGTAGNPGARLVLQSDGNAVVYSSTNVPLWSSSTAGLPGGESYVAHTLRSPGSLYELQNLTTANRKYRMILQPDGNLVVYSPTRAIWSSGTAGKEVAGLYLQGDGNLVIYGTSGRALWSSSSAGNGSSRLVMQGDGNLVIYGQDGKPTWSSGTSGAQ